MIRIVNGQEVLGLGEYAVRRPEGTLAALGLGSCVAVILHEPEAQVGAMAHVVLPSQSLSKERDRPGRFPETAVPLLLTAMQAQGANMACVTARLVGGASMFGSLTPSGTMHMGQRNVAACRTAIRAAGLQIFAEAVGGGRGRSVWFDVASGLVTVRSVGDEPIQL